ncbi:MAG: hypothetical protein ABJA90_10565, partial [Ginsengibacter sp.]
MRKNLYFMAMLIFFASCSSTRNSIANTQEDIILLNAIKSLDKHSSDTSLQNRLSSLYEAAAKVHLNNIDVYSTLIEPGKWDKIISEYNALQHLSDVINKSASAKKLMQPDTYDAKIEVEKEHAADDYYNIGMSLINNNDKQSSRDAYYAFKKSLLFVSMYKDAERQMNTAYQNSILSVVINPVTDNSYYYNNAGWNNYGNSFNNDY